MHKSRPRYVDVDELSRRVSVEQVLNHFGLVHEIAHRTGNEIRARCFLNCGRTEPTGERALAIKDEDVKKWACHQYECPHKAGGNLVGLIDLILPGPNGHGRPRGERFKEVLRTLEAIAGDTQAEMRAVVAAPDRESKSEPPKTNPPLADSANERARSLLNLHEKFMIDVSAMNPLAASYFRRRPYLTGEVAQAWRMGYLPRDSGGDPAGGTMRGRIVYQLHNAEGQVIGYCGRDPDFERKHAAWVSSGRQGNEPVKTMFPKGLHRGLLLYGEHRLNEPAVIEHVRSAETLFIVEGPNDVIRLSLLGAPAVAICSNRITEEQVGKLSRWVAELGNVPLTLLFDLDLEGETGMRQAAWELGQFLPVCVGWSRRLLSAHFRDFQPEQLSLGDWQLLLSSNPQRIFRTLSACSISKIDGRS